jgi:predicted nuclease of predicted toxin-antitoxin system
MRLLFDQNLSFRLCTTLADAFPDSTQVRQIGLDRAGDLDIWQYARTNGYAIVTQDADFAEMSALYGFPPKVIWLRCGNQPNSVIERLLRDNLAEIFALDGDTEASCLEVF